MDIGVTITLHRSIDSEQVTSSDTGSAAGITPRLRVVISCVTFETVKVVQPIRDLRAERVYLLHWGMGSDKKSSIYSEFYSEVVRQLKELGLQEKDIVERRVEVYRFKKVLAELLAVMSHEVELENDVYVNISAGTSEFAAAATVASMMVKGVRPFTVHTKEYTISGEDRIRECYSINGKLVGQSREVREPTELPTFHLSPPPEDLVVALRILRDRKRRGLSTKYSAMIQSIKEAGAWTYDAERLPKLKDRDTRHGERVLQAEKMYYSRHYIDGWIRNGWVDEKGGRGKSIRMISAGDNVADIFYLQ